MKKKVFLLIPALLLIGCGENNMTTSENNNTINGKETTSSLVISTQPIDDSYIVSIKYPNGKAVTGEVSVEWWNEEGLVKSVQVNDKGIASTNDLKDGTYSIHISNVPDGYAYNPNGYEVNESKKSIVIFLSEILNYEDGDGSKYIDGKNKGPYVIQSNGVYNASLTDEKPLVYYIFKPSKPGKFIIESWALECDPILYVIGNNFAFIPDYVDTESTFDNISKSNKNFKYEFEITSKEYGVEGSGYSIVFGISVNDDNKKVNFPFNVNCLASYDYYNPGSDSTITYAEAKDVPNIYERIENASIAVPNIDGTDAPYYNRSDKFYHLNSENGPVLLANFDRSNDLFYESFVDIQSGEAPDRALTIEGVNYNNFITQYKAAMNIDGLVPVNRELKEFLDKFMKADRLGILSYEGLTYDSNSWMACCSYYLVEK